MVTLLGLESLPLAEDERREGVIGIPEVANDYPGFDLLAGRCRDCALVIREARREVTVILDILPFGAPRIATVGENNAEFASILRSL
jgi:hypothetical protein